MCQGLLSSFFFLFLHLFFSTFIKAMIGITVTVPWRVTGSFVSSYWALSESFVIFATLGVLLYGFCFTSAALLQLF